MQKKKSPDRIGTIGWDTGGIPLAMLNGLNSGMEINHPFRGMYEQFNEHNTPWPYIKKIHREAFASIINGKTLDYVIVEFSPEEYKFICELYTTNCIKWIQNRPLKDKVWALRYECMRCASLDKGSIFNGFYDTSLINRSFSGSPFSISGKY